MRDSLKGKINLCIDLKVKKMIKLISETYNMTEEKSSKIFYSSETYKMLINDKTKLWAEGEVYIMETFEEELREKLNKTK